MRKLTTYTSKDGVAPVSEGHAAPGRYAHLDTLRALAIALVLLGHAGLGGIVPGGSGVTVFFVISGFIITHLLLKERSKTGKFSIFGFFYRRFIKLMPPLAVAVILPSAALLLAGTGGGTLLGLASQIFFAYNWVEIYFHALKVLSGTDVVWSLAIEEQFYFVIAPLWLLLVSRFKRPLVGISLLAMAMVMASILARFMLASDPANTWRIYRGTDTRMDALGLGVLTAVGLWKWQQLGDSAKSSWGFRLLASQSMSLIAVAAFLSSLVIREPFFRDSSRYAIQAACVVPFIVAGFREAPHLIARVVSRIGSRGPVRLLAVSSYSIYLVHLTVMNIVNRSTPPLLLGVVVNLTLGVGVGLALFWLVERPCLANRERIAALVVRTGTWRRSRVIRRKYGDEHAR